MLESQLVSLFSPSYLVSASSQNIDYRGYAGLQICVNDLQDIKLIGY